MVAPAIARTPAAVPVIFVDAEGGVGVVDELLSSSLQPVTVNVSALIHSALMKIIFKAIHTFTPKFCSIISIALNDVIGVTGDNIQWDKLDSFRLY